MWDYIFRVQKRSCRKKIRVESNKKTSERVSFEARLPRAQYNTGIGEGRVNYSSP